MLHYFNTDSNYNVVAFCVDNKYLDSDSFCALPLSTFEDIEQKFPPSKTEAFVAVGYSNMRAKKSSSKIFFKIYAYFTESNPDSTVANFSIISHKVVTEIRKLREQNIAYQWRVNWFGFKRIEIEIEHSRRIEGKSSYTLKKLINLAIDSIVSQSNKPLKLSIKFGFMLSFLSLIYGIWLIMKYFLYSIPVEGWTSVMVSIYFIGGLLFANMGILGLYIGKIYDETKRRPIYVVSETTFQDNTIKDI